MKNGLKGIKSLASEPIGS